MGLNDPLTHVFVYGTLKPGECNYKNYCAERVVKVRQAIARGQLFALPLGYPAMTVGEGIIQGVILSFPDDSILSDLDQLEDYQPDRLAQQNEYQRQQIQTYQPENQHPLEVAWAYVMEITKVQALGGVQLPQGYWSQK